MAYLIDFLFGLQNDKYKTINLLILKHDNFFKKNKYLVHLLKESR